MIAPNAMIADALSTALYVANRQEALDLIRHAQPSRVLLIPQNGDVEWIEG